MNSLRTATTFWGGNFFMGTQISPLLFCHIPKTAGSSLKTLVGQASRSVAWVYKGELALGNPNLEFARSFRAAPRPDMVMGHFSFGGHRLLGIAPRYATILRHPIDRVVSLYRHQTALTASGGPVSPEIADAIRNGLTLRGFITSQVTEMTNNHMCRMIAGIPPEAGMKLTESWLLDLALHNLRRHFLVAGTVAAIDDAVAAVGKLLGWRDPRLGVENTSEGAAPELGADTLATLSEFNALDLQLYREVADHPERYGIRATDRLREAVPSLSE
jgi:hypothetical protein